MHSLQILGIFLFYYKIVFSEVLELTDQQFDSALSRHEVSLVLFYAPWCGHCKKMENNYVQASDHLYESHPTVALIKVDCTSLGKNTCEKNHVHGYPTLKIFRRGEFDQEYNGPRDAVGIIKYMKAQVGPSSKELFNLDQLEDFLAEENDNALLIGFFDKDSGLKSMYFELAHKMRGKFRCAHTTNRSLIIKEGVSDGIELYRANYLHNKFESNSAVYSGKPNLTEIDDFIARNFHGLVGYRTLDNIDDFKNPLVVAYFTIDNQKNPGATRYWRNRILSVAAKFKGKINFAVSSPEEFAPDMEDFGLSSDVTIEIPTVVARDAQNQRFIMKEEFSVPGLESFVNDVLNQKIEPFIKSEPLPPKDSANGHVKVAVAKNFKNLVLNSKKDTLVAFYAPWCDYCKKLEPHYEELADLLWGEEIELFKMNAVQNDVPDPYEVDGYPTIYWTRRDNKDNPVKYEGGREDSSELLKFIAKHATVELKGYDRDGNKKNVKNEL